MHRGRQGHARKLHVHAGINGPGGPHSHRPMCVFLVEGVQPGFLATERWWPRRCIIPAIMPMHGTGSHATHPTRNPEMGAMALAAAARIRASHMPACRPSACARLSARNLSAGTSMSRDRSWAHSSSGEGSGQAAPGRGSHPFGACACAERRQIRPSLLVLRGLGMRVRSSWCSIPRPGGEPSSPACRERPQPNAGHPSSRSPRPPGRLDPARCDANCDITSAACAQQGPWKFKGFSQVPNLGALFSHDLGPPTCQLKDCHYKQGARFGLSL